MEQNVTSGCRERLHEIICYMTEQRKHGFICYSHIILNVPWCCQPISHYQICHHNVPLNETRLKLTRLLSRPFRVRYRTCQ